jgi:pyruvate dehydrogenase E2 component (dihydrolipoamide acetyltransferase)
MAEAIYLPKVGMTMEEGTLSKWIVADGESVQPGQPIFEMETEKVNMEVEAEHEGALKQLVPEGTQLKPGDVVGCLLAPGEEVPQALMDRVTAQMGDTPAASQTTAAEVAATPPPVEPQGQGTAPPQRVSPVARRLADEHGIDVRSLTGSGPDGRIVERDVQRAIDARTTAPEEPAGEEAEAPLAPPSSTAAPSPADGLLGYQGRRRTIGERMKESQASMAQVTLHSETPVDEAMKILHGLNREWRADGVVVTLTALVVRACALALEEQPRLNARLDGLQIVLSEAVNVGIAVDHDDGLMVPVIQNADGRSLKDVSAAVRDLTSRVKSGALGVDDVSGGSFTVTSLEGSGVDAFTPIINPPQAAILGIGRVRDVAGFDGSDVVRRQVTTLSLTFDHRLNDGAPAARFLDRIAELLQRPYMLM